MALTLKTPGVYVEEVSTLPASVAAVATAIPAFIGYTEKGPSNTPTRIVSMLEYESIFGGPQHEVFSVSVTGYPANAPVVTFANPSKFNMHYQLQMYFGNGGGPCYIVSVGDYSTVNPFASATPFTNGIISADKADEITLLIVPESVHLTSTSERKAVNDALLADCARMQDRFAIIDAITTTSITSDATNFRNEVGVNNLKFGAVYYPSLKTVLNRYYLDNEVAITGSATYVGPANNNLYSVKTGVATYRTLQVDALPANGNDFVLATVTFTARTGALLSNSDFKIGATVNETAKNIAAVINSNPVTGASFYATVATDTVTVISRTGGVATFAMSTTFTTAFDISSATLGTDNTQNTALYADIKALLDDYLLTLYPSASMAGIYAAVDNTRGVWKAPANVSLNLVDIPSIQITNESQENLNVDVTGKSINAIRNFNGRGVLVWGARTLDGNSNEWRYVNVRRLFIMAEESCRKATEFVVFEPNDKNTWNRVKGMISNFLTTLWRDGALAGDKAEQAFFVKVGLNETMTAEDILEGRLIVEIGMAAVRPAEFIVLRFSHKLQEA